MNRLPFGSFHAAHFSPQHVQQWHAYLQQLQPNPSYQYHQQQETESHTVEESWQTEEESWQAEDLEDLSLSKEAIEIFEFSEAYSKEQQDTKDTEENEAERNQHDTNTILNISTTLYHDGIEAPATSLVLLSSPPIQQEPTPSRILTQQHLINSAYLESCDPKYKEGIQIPLVMWPVLPFRL